MFHFYTPYKHQKISSLAASEDISQTGNFEKTNVYLTQQNRPFFSEYD